MDLLPSERDDSDFSVGVHVGVSDQDFRERSQLEIRFYFDRPLGVANGHLRAFTPFARRAAIARVGRHHPFKRECDLQQVAALQQNLPTVLHKWAIRWRCS